MSHASDECRVEFAPRETRRVESSRLDVVKDACALQFVRCG